MEEFCVCHVCGTFSLEGWENDCVTPTCDVQRNKNEKGKN
jgi:hypothetical protein